MRHFNNQATSISTVRTAVYSKLERFLGNGKKYSKFLKVLLLPRQAEAGIQTSRGEREDHNLLLTSERESFGLLPAE